MTLLKLLEQRVKDNNDLKVAIVGAGQMGEGMACQIELIDGMKCIAIADIDIEAARKAFDAAEITNSSSPVAVEVKTTAEAEKALQNNHRIYTNDYTIFTSLKDVDIIVESTGIPEIGAQVAEECIKAKKHILQMNVETDATVGYILRKKANEAGIIYTLTCGDEPGAIMELYDFAKSLGFEVTCVGKGKNNPLNRDTNPDMVKDIAKEKKMNPKMLASFMDGTKTMVELTSIGNAIGFKPDVFGGHGPNSTPKTLPQVFIPKEEGGVFTHKKGVVDFAVGVAPGVFVIFTTKNEKILRDLKYHSMGDGPYYALFRPYHMCNLETPVSILRAVDKKETTLATDRIPTIDAVAVAKKDLQIGDKLDVLGGFTVYGMIEEAETSLKKNMLPIGLAPGAVMVKSVKKGDILTYEDVKLDETQSIVKLRKEQDILSKQHYHL